MNDEIARLLDDYAANRLTGQQKQLLADAALSDQEVFDALAGGELLKQLYQEPRYRRALEGSQSLIGWLRRWLLGHVRFPSFVPVAAAVAIVFLGGSTVLLWRNMSRLESSAVQRRRQLEHELEEARRREKELAQRGPDSLVAVALTPGLGTRGPGAPPIPQIRIPGNAAALKLELPLASQFVAGEYRAVLETPTRRIWSQRGWRAEMRDGKPMVTVFIPPLILSPSEYVVKLYPVDRPGVEAGAYRFDVLSQ